MDLDWFQPLLRGVRVLLLPIGWLSERLGNRFYVAFAVVLGVLAIWALSAGFTREMQNQVYDLILKNRFSQPAPSSDVVVIDIDEASLAAMADEFGRWPWPRSLMAEFVEALVPAQPLAIVFDITFADRDIDHPEADAYLSDVASRERSTYFAMIRLNPNNDHLSNLRLASIAGVEQVSLTAPADATVAMTVPYFYSQLDGPRLGTNNLYTGADGVTRRFHVYRNVNGWRVRSLPANVVAALGKPLPDAQDILINWRGPPQSYERQSFHTLRKQLLAPGGSAVAERFREKIVVVGSTAPSLFDIKATPMGADHPGLEIFATVLDNLFSRDFLRPAPTWIYGAVIALVLSLLAAAFVYNLDYRLLSPAFTVVQLGFAVMTYLYLNYSTLFVDMSAPFTAGLVYFFVARGYAFTLNLRRNGNPFFSRRLDPGNRAQVLLVRCTLGGPPALARRRRPLLLRQAGLTRLGVAAPRIFRQTPLLNAHYKDTLLVIWLVAPEETADALSDLYDMLAASFASIDAKQLNGHEDGIYFQLDAFDFVVDKHEHTWQSAGRDALARALDARQREAGQVAPLGGFTLVCRANPQVPVPFRLREAGLVDG